MQIPTDATGSGGGGASEGVPVVNGSWAEGSLSDLYSHEARSALVTLFLTAFPGQDPDAPSLPAEVVATTDALGGTVMLGLLQSLRVASATPALAVLAGSPQQRALLLGAVLHRVNVTSPDTTQNTIIPSCFVAGSYDQNGLPDGNERFVLEMTQFATTERFLQAFSSIVGSESTLPMLRAANEALPWPDTGQTKRKFEDVSGPPQASLDQSQFLMHAVAGSADAVTDNYIANPKVKSDILRGHRADPHAFNVAADDAAFRPDLERLTSTVDGLAMVADNSDKLVNIATATLTQDSTMSRPLKTLQVSILIGDVRDVARRHQPHMKTVNTLHVALQDRLRDSFFANLARCARKANSLDSMASTAALSFMRMDGRFFDDGRSSPKSQPWRWVLGASAASGEPLLVQSRQDMEAWLKAVLRMYDLIGCPTSGLLARVMGRIDAHQQDDGVDSFRTIMHECILPLFRAHEGLYTHREGWLRNHISRLTMNDLLDPKDRYEVPSSPFPLRMGALDIIHRASALRRAHERSADMQAMRKELRDHANRLNSIQYDRGRRQSQGGGPRLPTHHSPPRQHSSPVVQPKNKKLAGARSGGHNGPKKQKPTNIRLAFSTEFPGYCMAGALANSGIPGWRPLCAYSCGTGDCKASGQILMHTAQKKPDGSKVPPPNAAKLRAFIGKHNCQPPMASAGSPKPKRQPARAGSGQAEHDTESGSQTRFLVINGLVAQFTPMATWNDVLMIGGGDYACFATTGVQIVTQKETLLYDVPGLKDDTALEVWPGRVHDGQVTDDWTTPGPGLSHSDWLEEEALESPKRHEPTSWNHEHGACMEPVRQTLNDKQHAGMACESGVFPKESEVQCLQDAGMHRLVVNLAMAELQAEFASTSGKHTRQLVADVRQLVVDVVSTSDGHMVYLHQQPRTSHRPLGPVSDGLASADTCPREIRECSRGQLMAGGHLDFLSAYDEVTPASVAIPSHLGMTLSPSDEDVKSVVPKLEFPTALDSQKPVRTGDHRTAQSTPRHTCTLLGVLHECRDLMEAHPVKVVVVAGGIGAGKTSSIPKAASALREAGTFVVVKPENVTSIRKATGFDMLKLSDPSVAVPFQRLALYQDAWDLLSAVRQAAFLTTTQERPAVVLCDRLFLCGKSFMGDNSWTTMLQMAGVTEFGLLSFCHGCVFVDSAAVGPSLAAYDYGPGTDRLTEPQQAIDNNSTNLEAWQYWQSQFTVLHVQNHSNDPDAKCDAVVQAVVAVAQPLLERLCAEYSLQTTRPCRGRQLGEPVDSRWVRSWAIQWPYDASRSPWRQIEKYLQSSGISCTDVGGGGDCIPRVLAHSLLGCAAFHKHVRVEVVRFLAENCGILLDGGKSALVAESIVVSGRDCDSFESCIQRLAQTGTWLADGFLIAAAAWSQSMVSVVAAAAGGLTLTEFSPALCGDIHPHPTVGMAMVQNSHARAQIPAERRQISVFLDAIVVVCVHDCSVHVPVSTQLSTVGNILDDAHRILGLDRTAKLTARQGRHLLPSRAKVFPLLPVMTGLHPYKQPVWLVDTEYVLARSVDDGLGHPLDGMHGEEAHEKAFTTTVGTRAKALVDADFCSVAKGFRSLALPMCKNTYQPGIVDQGEVLDPVTKRPSSGMVAITVTAECFVVGLVWNGVPEGQLALHGPGNRLDVYSSGCPLVDPPCQELRDLHEALGSACWLQPPVVAGSQAQADGAGKVSSAGSMLDQALSIERRALCKFCPGMDSGKIMTVARTNINLAGGTTEYLHHLEAHTTDWPEDTPWSLRVELLEQHNDSFRKQLARAGAPLPPAPARLDERANASTDIIWSLEVESLVDEHTSLRALLEGTPVTELAETENPVHDVVGVEALLEETPVTALAETEDPVHDVVGVKAVALLFLQLQTAQTESVVVGHPGPPTSLDGLVVPLFKVLRSTCFGLSTSSQGLSTDPVSVACRQLHVDSAGTFLLEPSGFAPSAQMVLAPEGLVCFPGLGVCDDDWDFGLYDSNLHTLCDAGTTPNNWQTSNGVAFVSVQQLLIDGIAHSTGVLCTSDVYGTEVVLEPHTKRILRTFLRTHECSDVLQEACGDRLLSYLDAVKMPMRKTTPDNTHDSWGPSVPTLRTHAYTLDSDRLSDHHMVSAVARGNDNGPTHPRSITLVDGRCSNQGASTVSSTITRPGDTPQQWHQALCAFLDVTTPVGTLWLATTQESPQTGGWGEPSETQVLECDWDGPVFMSCPGDVLWVDIAPYTTVAPTCFERYHPVYSSHGSLGRCVRMVPTTKAAPPADLDDVPHNATAWELEYRVRSLVGFDDCVIVSWDYLFHTAVEFFHTLQSDYTRRKPALAPAPVAVPWQATDYLPIQSTELLKMECTKICADLSAAIAGASILVPAQAEECLHKRLPRQNLMQSRPPCTKSVVPHLKSFGLPDGAPGLNSVCRPEVIMTPEYGKYFARVCKQHDTTELSMSSRAFWGHVRKAFSACTDEAKSIVSAFKQGKVTHKKRRRVAWLCVPLEAVLSEPYMQFVQAGGILDLRAIDRNDNGVVTAFDQDRGPLDDDTTSARRSFLTDLSPTDGEAARKFVDGFDLHADCRHVLLLNENSPGFLQHLNKLYDRIEGEVETGTLQVHPGGLPPTLPWMNVRQSVVLSPPTVAHPEGKARPIGDANAPHNYLLGGRGVSPNDSVKAADTSLLSRPQMPTVSDLCVALAKFAAIRSHQFGILLTDKANYYRDLPVPPKDWWKQGLCIDAIMSDTRTYFGQGAAVHNAMEASAIVSWCVHVLVVACFALHSTMEVKPGNELVASTGPSLQQLVHVFPSLADDNGALRADVMKRIHTLVDLVDTSGLQKWDDATSPAGQVMRGYRVQQCRLSRERIASRQAAPQSAATYQFGPTLDTFPVYIQIMVDDGQSVAPDYARDTLYGCMRVVTDHLGLHLQDCKTMWAVNDVVYTRTDENWVAQEGVELVVLGRSLRMKAQKKSNTEEHRTQYSVEATELLSVVNNDLISFQRLRSFLGYTNFLFEMAYSAKALMTSLWSVMRAKTQLRRPQALYLNEWGTLTSVEQWKQRRLSYETEHDFLVPFGARQVLVVKTLVQAVSSDTGLPFCQTQLPPGKLVDGVTFVVNDAAGNANDGSYRGGCSLIFGTTSEFTDVCTRPFTENQLLGRNSSSTALEASNAHATAESVSQSVSGDIVEILDSASAVSAFQRHKTSSVGLEQALDQRAFLVRELAMSNRRIFTLWSPRDGLVSLADSGSKRQVSRLDSGLASRGLPPARFNHQKRPGFELVDGPGWQKPEGLVIHNNPVPPDLRVDLRLFTDDSAQRWIFVDILGQRHVVVENPTGMVWAATGEQCEIAPANLQPLSASDCAFVAHRLQEFPEQVPMPQPGGPVTCSPRSQLQHPQSRHDELRCAVNNVLGRVAVQDEDLQGLESVISSTREQSINHGYDAGVLEELFSCTKWLNPSWSGPWHQIRWEAHCIATLDAGQLQQLLVAGAVVQNKKRFHSLRPQGPARWTYITPSDGGYEKSVLSVRTLRELVSGMQPGAEFFVLPQHTVHARVEHNDRPSRDRRRPRAWHSDPLATASSSEQKRLRLYAGGGPVSTIVGQWGYGSDESEAVYKALRLMHLCGRGFYATAASVAALPNPTTFIEQPAVLVFLIKARKPMPLDLVQRAKLWLQSDKSLNSLKLLDLQTRIATIESELLLCSEAEKLAYWKPTAPYALQGRSGYVEPRTVAPGTRKRKVWHRKVLGEDIAPGHVLVVRPDPDNDDPYWLAVTQRLDRRTSTASVMWLQAAPRSNMYVPEPLVEEGQITTEMCVGCLLTGDGEQTPVRWNGLSVVVDVSTHQSIVQVMHEPTTEGGSDVVDHKPEHSKEDLRSACGPTPSTLKSYSSLCDVYERFCLRCGKEPSYKLDIDVAYDFAEHLIEEPPNSRRVMSLGKYFTALNHRSELLHGERPWAGGPVSKLIKGFRRFQLRRARAQGEVTPGLRVAVPAAMIEQLIAISDDLVATPSRQSVRPVKPGMVAAWATMLLLGLRASSMRSIVPTQTLIKVDRDGVTTVTLTINHVKCGDAESKPFTRTICGDKSTRHPRSVLVAVIAAHHHEWTPEFWGVHAATTITDAMRDGLDHTCLPPNMWVGSHSWRKAGASALAVLNVSLLTIKSWGMWVSTSSVERYVDARYSNSRVTKQLFDFATH